MRNILLLGVFLFFNTIVMAQFVSGEKALADVDYVVTTLSEVYPTYRNLSMPEFDAQVREVKNRVSNGVTDRQLCNLIDSSIVRFVGDPHVFVYCANFKVSKSTRFPYRLKMVDGVLCCLEKVSYKWMHVVSVNGHNALELFNYLKKEHVNVSTSGILENFDYYYWLHFDDYGSWNVTFANTSSVINSTETNNGEKNFEFSVISHDSIKIGNLKIKQFDGFNKSDVCRVFEQIRHEAIDKLVIDLRGNGGGFTSLSDYLLTFIAKAEFRTSIHDKIFFHKKIKKNYWRCRLSIFNWPLFLLSPEIINSHGEQDEDNTFFYKPGIYKPELSYGGSLVVLIDEGTSSCADNFARVVKNYKFGMIVGQPTVYKALSCSDPVYFKMPNSKLIFTVPHRLEEGLLPTPEDINGTHPDVECLDENGVDFAINLLIK